MFEIRAIFLILISFSIWSPAGFAELWVSSHPGYLSDVKDERYQRLVEIILVPKPQPLGPPLRDLIFDQKITKDFQDQYALRFGQTEIQRNFIAPGRNDEFEYSTGAVVSIEEDIKNKRQFGEYMIRRLGEHHVDIYARSSPSIRPAYELKERISNVNLEVRQGYKFKVNYSFSGNFVGIKMENPYKIDTKLTLQMSSGSLGPGDIKETYLNLGYSFENKIRLESQYAQEDGILDVIGSKGLSETLTASITGSVYTNNTGTSIRQNLLLVGLAWTQ